MNKQDALAKCKAIKDYLTAGNPMWDKEEVAEAMTIAIEALTHEEAHETHNVREEKMKHRGKFTSRQIADIVMSLNGEVEPVGETNTDSERYDNLIRLLCIADILLDEIYSCCKYSDRQEFSMRRSGDVATTWMGATGGWVVANFGGGTNETD